MSDILLITQTFLQNFMDTDIRFHPIYLVPFLMTGIILFFIRRSNVQNKIRFLQWMFPQKIYFHPSHIIDLKVFILGRVITLTKIFSTVMLTTAFAVAGMGLIGWISGFEISAQEITLPRLVLATFIITIVTDFCVYWVHRLHHEHPIIWPFHAVHHSAEVMTPITVYRKHPLYDVLSNCVKSVLVGLTQGVILVLIMGEVGVQEILGINIFYFVFNMAGSNFRHSHIWFRYGIILEHIFISPAQHQIHHSLEPKHHNKNYGEIFALWDWMFGTLYVPAGYENLEFGISKSSTSNVRIVQPHDSLRNLLILPFKQSWKILQQQSKGQGGNK